MWNGKNKAVTLSYDDGVESDRRLVEILGRYGLKCTFNLNSGIMGPESCWEDNGVTIRRMSPEGLPELYRGHEIAVHCVTHANLLKLDDDSVRHEIMDDKAALEELFGCQIQGMAYPYGAYDQRIVRIAGECGIRFSRTCNDTHGFRLPEEPLAFGATCRHQDPALWELLERFLSYEGSEPAVFCLWGHSYEFDVNGNWDLIERFCSRVAGREEIFFGTNSQVFLEK
ncbi:MAG: polysaccharide deacetylase family protein [Ruminococcus sp.]|nr:polysaccharide deacetylase family protein [Ruminococcus sp.]